MTKETAQRLIKENPNYFIDRGSKGGKGATPDKRPFALSRDLASRAGTIGGLRGRIK